MVLINVFEINLPVISSLLGLSAKKNEGRPITKNSIRYRLRGSKGYSLPRQIMRSVVNMVIVVFIRNRLDEFCMLFTTRLPSATTLGMEENLLSKSTRCATLLLA